MPRDACLLYPPKALAPLLEAATLLLLRDSANGLEVLMTRRSSKASFAPGAYVFPGGGIEACDIEQAHLAPAFIARRTGQTPQQLTWTLAAVRESFEELRIVLAKQANGAWVSAEQIQRLRRDDSFYDQMQQMQLQIAADEVFLLAHWITDRDLPKRFNVRFLVARMPADQTPLADESEQFEPQWVRPQEALERHAQGRFSMIFPTVRTLQRLLSFASVDAVLHECASEQALWTSCPRAGKMNGIEQRLMEHESAYGELALVTPYGHIAHELAWQHERAVPLLRHLMRLTAPNASVMTGPGTNTYIVGTQASGYIVIDPGPALAQHVQRIMQATQGNVRAIVCTHSHADHSPAAALLQAQVLQGLPAQAQACADATAHPCPILGLPSAATAQPQAHFIPDITLEDGEAIERYLRPPEGAQALDFSLRVVLTPGHAANHVCLMMAEDSLLFSGDHILNGSTTVIDPPDGNMSAYLHSLERLALLCEQHDVRFIAPAHGHVLSHCLATGDATNPAQAQNLTANAQLGDARSDSAGGAVRAIKALLTHRRQREAKVRAAMTLKPQGSIEEWLVLAYADVDHKLWPIATRSLLAHVQRLQERDAPYGLA